MQTTKSKEKRLFDINLLPINLEKGVEGGSLPGLVPLTPPRRAARGRENDALIVLVSISGVGINPSEGFNTWLQKKAEGYYQTAGTVTFALKTLVETLNNDLLARNLKRAKEGSRMSASLSLAVLKRDSLYLVNIGSAHSYFASATESVEFATPETLRGLGVDQMLTCRFSQREVQANDILVMNCQPPDVWKAETFAGCAALSIEAVSRRLFDQVGGDLKAALIRFTPGKGIVNPITLTSRRSISPRPEQSVHNQPANTEEVLTVTQSDAEVIATPIQLTDTPLIPAEPVEKKQLQPFAGEPSNRKNQAAATSMRSMPKRPMTGSTAKMDSPGKTISQPSQVQVKAGKVTRQLVSWVNKISSTFSRWIQKILPGLADEPLKLTRNALIGIAVGIPMLIVLIASIAYVKMGKSEQFDQNLQMAQQYAVQAELQVNDPPLRLASLQQSIFWLDKAESYGGSNTSEALRLKVQAQLDVLQGIQRLEMVEVIPGGLEAGSKVTQIVATSTDLYLLDETSGTVKRYYLNGSSYVTDETFDCGPNPDNPLNMLGKIVDMIPLNVNNTFKATLLAIDDSGNTEFCIPADAGVTVSLTAPDQGWKKITSISMFNNNLYILDNGGNAVYRYEGDGILFEDKPTLFFDNQIPDLIKAIDIEVNGDELYILRSNGQMVECTYSHMKEYKLTECQDPAPYGDMRTGQVPEAITFPEANFIQMRMTAAPDSSIYLLDTTSKALFHFSLQRNLQKVLHPRSLDGSDLDKLSPSAIAVSSARIAFMAFGNQVYYSPLP